MPDPPRQALRADYFVACISARDNDPELASVLPGWGAPGTFDAEDAAAVVSTMFGDVVVERSDAPLIHLPDPTALSLFLRWRGLSVVDAWRAAARFPTPMDVTKRGCLVWARR